MSKISLIAGTSSPTSSLRFHRRYSNRQTPHRIGIGTRQTQFTNPLVSPCVQADWWLIGLRLIYSPFFSPWLAGQVTSWLSHSEQIGKYSSLVSANRIEIFIIRSRVWLPDCLLILPSMAGLIGVRKQWYTTVLRVYKLVVIMCLDASCSVFSFIAFTTSKDDI